VRTTGTVPEGPESSAIQVSRTPPQEMGEPAQTPEPVDEQSEPPQPASKVMPFEPPVNPPARRGGLYEDLEEESVEIDPGTSDTVYPYTNTERARKLRWDEDVRKESRAPEEEEDEEPYQIPVPVLREEPQGPASGAKVQLPSGEYTRQQLNRYIAYNPKQTVWTRFMNASMIDKGLIVGLILAILAVGALFVSFINEGKQAGQIPPTATPASTTEALGIPVPMGLSLPGGWHFQVSTGHTVDGKWEPVSSEWLEGTEIRRVIAIPWNKQVEAVVRTFEAGDTINLEMSNGDRLSYKVQTVSQVPETETSILYDTHPSLAVILMDPEADQRWVIVAAP
jgi:hypothetical protein